MQFGKKNFQKCQISRRMKFVLSSNLTNHFDQLYFFLKVNININNVISAERILIVKFDFHGNDINRFSFCLLSLWTFISTEVISVTSSSEVKQQKRFQIIRECFNHDDQTKIYHIFIIFSVLFCC